MQHEMMSISGNIFRNAVLLEVVLATGRGYRLPEPTRQADLYVNALRRGEEAC